MIWILVVGVVILVGMGIHDKKEPDPKKKFFRSWFD